MTAQYTYAEAIAAGKKAVAAGDNAAANEIASYIDRAYPQGPAPAPESTPVADFLESAKALPANMSDSLTEGFTNYTTQLHPGEAGTENPVTAAANIIRPGLAVMGDVGKTGVKAWMATYGQLIPDSIKKSVMESDVLQQGVELLEKGYDYYQQWAEAHPDGAAMLEDAGVVAEVATPKIKASIPGIDKPIRSQTRKATDKTLTKRRKGIYDLIRTPDSQGRVRESSTGTGRREIWEPDLNEKNIAHTLETVDAVDPDRSFRYNHDVVEQTARKFKKKLWTLLGKHHKTKVSKQDLLAEYDEVLAEMPQTEGYYALSSDARAHADRLLQETRRLIEVSGKGDAVRPRDLLKIRQEFDRLYNKSDSSGYEASAVSARLFAARQLRDVLNNKLKQVVGDGDVHDLLDRQHEMLKGRDILRAKRDKEATNMFARAWHKMREFGHLPTTPLALYALGTAAVGTGIAPVVGGTLAVGTGAWQAYNLATGPARNKMLAELLSTIDKAAKGDRGFGKELAAERALIIEMMKSNIEDDNEE